MYFDKLYLLKKSLETLMISGPMCYLPFKNSKIVISDGLFNGKYIDN